VTTWPDDPGHRVTPGGGLGFWFVVWVLINLILIQHARPRPARYTPPAHKACLMSYGCRP